MDAALCALCALACEESHAPHNAVRGAPHVNTLRVLVSALRTPTVRTMRCVSSFLCSLVGSGEEEALLHTPGALMLCVYMWAWACGPDAPLAGGLEGVQSQLLHIVWDYASGHARTPLPQPDASVEAQAIRIAINTLRRYACEAPSVAVAPVPPSRGGPPPSPSRTRRGFTPMSQPSTLSPLAVTPAAAPQPGPDPATGALNRGYVGLCWVVWIWGLMCRVLQLCVWVCVFVGVCACVCACVREC